MEKIRFKDYLIDYLEFNNITNKDFANRIGISQKHLIKILAGDADISRSIIDKISLVTNISPDYIYKMELNYRFEKEIEDFLQINNLTEVEYLNKFKYKYLIESKYLDFIDTESPIDIIKDILKFLRVPSPSKVKEIEKTIYYKSKNDKPELLLLWLEKCYRESLTQTVKEYRKENINELVNIILENAKNNIFNESELISAFNDNGIYLVIKEDLPGSKIRGAFKVHRGIPAIYITYKHKRIADIYFALLHELAHCKTDFNKAQASSFVSYEDEKNDLENKADEQAFNWMVDGDYYKSNCLNNNYKIENETIYPKSFVVYRLANDKVIEYSSSIYQKYNLIIKNI